MNASAATGLFTYQAIKRRLARDIGTRWRAGARLPTIAQLAAELGTGQRNTHRAVQELVSDGILVSRPGMGTYVRGEFQLSQLPDAATGRAYDLHVGSAPPRLASKRAVLVRGSTHDDQFQSLISQVIAQRLSREGIFVTQASCIDKAGNVTMPDAVADADAVVLVNPDSSMRIEPGPTQVMAVVTTSLDVDLHATRRVDFVSVDQVGGAMLAGQRLRAAGCKEVCYIGVRAAPLGRSPAKYDRTSALRLEGFERGWGGKVAESRKLLAHFYDTCVGARMVKHYTALDPRPQGVFCASDELAVGFVLGGLAAGLEPGTDYKLIGFDGQPIGRNLGEGPLTSVEAPLDEMGLRAAELLISRLENPDQPVRRLALGCRLHEGETVEASKHRVKSRRIYQS